MPDKKKVEPEVIIMRDGREMKVHRYVNGVEVDKDYFKNIIITNPIVNDILNRGYQKMINGEHEKLHEQSETTANNPEMGKRSRKEE